MVGGGNEVSRYLACDSHILLRYHNRRIIMCRDTMVDVISVADNVWPTIVLVLAENDHMNIDRYVETVN